MARSSPLQARVQLAECPPALQRKAVAAALEYMGLTPGVAIASVPIDRAFIGSCTNGRIEDLREVAKIMAGRKVKEGLRAMIVPGSGLVRAQAEDGSGDQWHYSAAAGVGEATVQRWKEAGLLKPSALKPLLATVEKELVIRKLGKLVDEDRDALRHSLKAILGE